MAIVFFQSQCQPHSLPAFRTFPLGKWFPHESSDVQELQLCLLQRPGMWTLGENLIQWATISQPTAQTWSMNRTGHKCLVSPSHSLLRSTARASIGANSTEHVLWVLEGASNSNARPMRGRMIWSECRFKRGKLAEGLLLDTFRLTSREILAQVQKSWTGEVTKHLESHREYRVCLE